MTADGSVEWSTTGSEYRMLLTRAVWNAICRHCGKNEGLETGGILMGYYTDDQRTAVVTEATPPPSDSKSGGTWFQRGVAGLQRLLRRRWVQRNRRYYLGEWHFHPALVVEPSGDDIRQMFRISEAETYNCPEPIMLIAGRAVNGERRCRAFVFPRSSSMREFFQSDRAEPDKE